MRQAKSEPCCLTTIMSSLSAVSTVSTLETFDRQRRHASKRQRTAIFRLSVYSCHYATHVERTPTCLGLMVKVCSESESLARQNMSDADRGTSLFVFVRYQFQQCRTTHYGKWVGTTACWIVGSRSFICLHQIVPIFSLRLQTFLYHRLARLLFIVPLLTYSITVFSVSSYAPFN